MEVEVDDEELMLLIPFTAVTFVVVDILPSDEVKIGLERIEISPFGFSNEARISSSFGVVSVK